MKIKLSLRFISLFLSVVLLFCFIPSVIYAEAAEAVSGFSDDASFSASENSSYSGVLYEDISKREENLLSVRSISP